MPITDLCFCGINEVGFLLGEQFTVWGALVHTYIECLHLPLQYIHYGNGGTRSKEAEATTKRHTSLPPSWSEYSHHHWTGNCMWSLLVYITIWYSYLSLGTCIYIHIAEACSVQLVRSVVPLACGSVARPLASGIAFCSVDTFHISLHLQPLTCIVGSSLIGHPKIDVSVTIQHLNRDTLLTDMITSVNSSAACNDLPPSSLSLSLRFVKLENTSLRRSASSMAPWTLSSLLPLPMAGGGSLW